MLAADRGDAERRERHDVAVELADPVDQPVAAGVADQDVEAGAAVDAVLVDRRACRWHRRSRAAVGACRARRRRSSRSLPQPPYEVSWPVPPTIQSLPRSPKITSLPSLFVGDRDGRAVRGESTPPVTSGPSFETKLRNHVAAAGAGSCPCVPSSLRRIDPPRVVLVVEGELARAGSACSRATSRRRRRSAACRRGCTAASSRCGRGRAGRRVVGVEVLRCTTRVSASPPPMASSPDGAVQEVVAQAAEDDVVGRGWRRTADRRRPAALGVRLNGVMSTAFFSSPATLIVAVCTWPGV